MTSEMKNIYLLKYNNYYNRIVKKEETLQDYAPYGLEKGFPICYKIADGAPVLTTEPEKFNFVPNDEINTEQVINWTGDIPDYLIVSNEDGTIDSRWFVIDHIRIRGQQFKLSLHRDLVVDYYEETVNAPTFIEKATVSPQSPLIFNSENMSYNQIKTKETLLKDATGCPWVVIYFNSKPTDDKPYNVVLESKEIQANQVFATEEAFKDWSVYQAKFNPVWETCNTQTVQCTANVNYGNHREAYTFYTMDGSTTSTFLEFNSSAYWDLKKIPNTVENARQDIQNAWNADNNFNELSTYATAYITHYSPSTVQEIREKNGWTIKAGAKYYKLIAEEIQSLQNITVNGAIKTFMDSVLNGLGQDNRMDKRLHASFLVNYVGVRFEEISGISGVSVNIPNERVHTLDAPYDIIAAPLSDTLKFVNSNSSDIGWRDITNNKGAILKFASAFVEQYASAVYDVQILPYCPYQGAVIDKATQTMDLNGLNKLGYLAIDDNGGYAVAYYLYISHSSFSTSIQLEEPIVIQDYKVENECDMYRLCSPNYNGVFEFSAAKNRGVDYFNVSCTYKPFNPYIKIYPNFKGLYGSDYNDNRGLICGGDFSFPRTEDAFKTYELQNKNYQLAFERQIQNMEVNNSIQRQLEQWSTRVGAVQGLTAGTGLGAMMGGMAGPIGGIVGGALGGIVGGITSTLGGHKDLELNDKLRAEALSYTKDQFGYSLGNIKALPLSLSKVSAFNQDNKYFPFLEYYTCTETEKQALRDKLKYNGMTVMVIGSIKEYLQEEPSYIKGRIIRLPETYNVEMNVANAIATEIYQGVFI